ncbi:hypothetical protein HBB16_11375 [Pseudonocardia sp. MCCB 268]|nr:hypothetical protein [Pseudonocardia cytotoxica]
MLTFADGASASVSIPTRLLGRDPQPRLTRSMPRTRSVGAPLLIGTVEQLTEVQVDHFGVVGLRRLLA